MDGFINILKPQGPTASDMVVRLRGILKQKKIGHLGTLDPGACGVLPIAVGKGTKLFDFLVFKRKKYRAFFTFGKTTDTLDSFGVLVEEKDFVFDKDAMKNALQNGLYQNEDPSRLLRIVCKRSQGIYSCPKRRVA